MDGTRMKHAGQLTLVLGSLSLMIAVVAVFIFYLEWISKPNIQAIIQPPSLAESVANATDIKSLKTVCQLLARSQDRDSAFLHDQAALVKRFLIGVATFSLVWGLICGVAFLYIHFILRRLCRESNAHVL